MISKDLFLILSQRSWQAFSGFLTTIIATIYLTPSEQGWYYTFLSIASLYVLFELGLSTALIQTTSHMFIKLKWTKSGLAVGNDRRIFNSFLFRSVNYFLVVAPLFFLIISFAGYFVLSNKSPALISNVHWNVAWNGLVLLTALNLITIPFLSVVEGSGKVAEVYALRLFQGLLGSLFCWVFLIAGFGLWSTLMIPLCSFLVFLVWLLNYRYGLLKVWADGRQAKTFNWLKEILPFQWRLGLSWISFYFMSQLTVPIVFHFFNPVLAGRIGLCLAIAHMVGIFSQSWIAKIAPSMSQAVARRDWTSFDNLFKKNFRFSLYSFIGLSVFLSIVYLVILDTNYGVRLLPFNLFICLLIFVFFYHINNSLAAQLRSYKKEPLVLLFLLGAVLIVGLSLFLSSIHLFDWVIYSMCLVQSLVIFPFAFLKYREYNKALRAYNLN